LLNEVCRTVYFKEPERVNSRDALLALPCPEIHQQLE